MEANLSTKQTAGFGMSEQQQQRYSLMTEASSLSSARAELNDFERKSLVHGSVSMKTLSSQRSVASSLGLILEKSRAGGDFCTQKNALSALKSLFICLKKRA